MERIADLRQRILDEAIIPNAAKLAPALLAGDVAVVFFEVQDGRGSAAASMAGWSGDRTGTGRISRAKAHAIAARLPVADPARGWLLSDAEGRILVFAHRGVLCVNYRSGEGYSMAPGALDQEWMF